MTGSGDCFIVAFQAVMANPRLVVAHGLVTGQGPLEGVRFSHAWCELGSVVIDRSNGLDYTGPRSRYYRVGRIREADVRRYTADQARVEALRTEHYGPWDDALLMVG